MPAKMTRRELDEIFRVRRMISESLKGVNQRVPPAYRKAHEAKVQAQMERVTREMRERNE
jgi:hypothetical protein